MRLDGMPNGQNKIIICSFMMWFANQENIVIVICFSSLDYALLKTQIHKKICNYEEIIKSTK